MTETTLSVAQPQQFVQLVERIIAEDRPAWSGRALSKFMSIVFPRISSNRWETCLVNPARLDKVMAVLTEDEGWVLGRIHRALCEARDERLWENTSMNALSWIETFDLNTGASQGGGGFQGLIIDKLSCVLRTPTAAQIPFLSSFAKAFSLPLITDQHDRKTVIAYIYFGLWWREVKQCQTIRQAYEAFQRRFPFETPSKGQDPVDLEERRFKWFEKLCKRNLGVSLSRRGRPPGKHKYPQP